MTQSKDPLTVAIERVAHYVELRGKAQGLDPDDIHGMNANGQFACLTLSDLRTILSALTAPRAAADTERDLDVHSAWREHASKLKPKFDTSDYQNFFFAGWQARAALSQRVGE